MSRIHLDFCLQSHSSGVAGLFSDKTESVSVSRYKSTWFVCTRLRENQLFPLDHLYEAYLKIKATGAYIPAPTVSLFAIPATKDATVTGNTLAIIVSVVRSGDHLLKNLYRIKTRCLGFTRACY